MEGKDEGKMCFGAEWLKRARRRFGESLPRETKRKAKSARGREAGGEGWSPSQIGGSFVFLLKIRNLAATSG